MLNKTRHILFNTASKVLSNISPRSVQLVVTSPPYPMIEMWDDILSDQNPEIRELLKKEKGYQAFELMHRELDKSWAEVDRVLSPGGIACINIGDATRTIGSEFAIYPNHARIIEAFLKLRFVNLPNIIWRKQTNAPNKFMGSGMLPAGAYVTLEHEWILIFRKGSKRVFTTDEEKMKRRESAFFWEERNSWFSDVWDLKGSRQLTAHPDTRNRTAAYPFEIPYRLINMYSVKGDYVLDPFSGTGTTALAAAACQRNSLSAEIDPSFCRLSMEKMMSADLNALNHIITTRLQDHKKFIESRVSTGKEIRHFNEHHQFAVMTGQETALQLNYLQGVKKTGEYESDFAYSETKELPVTVINASAATL